MRKKTTNNTIFLLAMLLFLTVSLYAIERNEIPRPSDMYIDQVIDIIPNDIKGIAEVEFDNNQWVVKTINISDNVTNTTSKYIEKKYRLYDTTKKFLEIEKEYENDEQLPPSYSSLKGAIETVQKTAQNDTIVSIEFDEGSWEVKAVNNDNPKALTVTKYLINPVNSVITQQKTDD